MPIGPSHIGRAIVARSREVTLPWLVQVDSADAGFVTFMDVICRKVRVHDRIEQHHFASVGPISLHVVHVCVNLIQVLRTKFLCFKVVLCGFGREFAIDNDSIAC